MTADHDQLLAEVDEIQAAVSRAPWEVKRAEIVYDAGGTRVANCWVNADAAFIARARTLVPQLADALREAREETRTAYEAATRIATEAEKSQAENQRLRDALHAVNNRADLALNTDADALGVLAEISGLALGALDDFADDGGAT